MSGPVKGRLKAGLQVGRALRLVWESGPGWMIASLALLLAQGLLPLASLYLTKLVVDAITAGLGAPDKGAAFWQVARLIALAGGVTVALDLCQSISGLVREAQQQAVSDHLQEVLQAQSVAVDLEYYENAEYYDLLHRTQAEAPFRTTRTVYNLVSTGQGAIGLLGIAGLLFALDAKIALIVLGAAVPGALVRVRYSKQLYRRYCDWTPAERQASYIGGVLTTDWYAREVRLLELGPLLIRRFRALRDQLRRERFRIAARRSLLEGAAETGASLAIYGSYAFLAYQTIHRAISLGDLMMYYQAFQRGQGLLQSMLASLAGLYEDNLFLANFSEFMALPRRVVEPLSPRPVPSPLREGIVFDRVSFDYPGDRPPALAEINLTIRPGQVVALVGENGAGKTTLVKLLCRLYDPTQGAIRMDGIDLREFATTDLRQQISVIFQDFVRYHVTARENIWFGDVRLPPGDERIAAAAEGSGAAEVIATLKSGYETVLGKMFDEGELLSEGQWQRIALARAFLREAQILVLDEPTSALDAAAEEAFFHQFRQLVKGRIGILISHRFSTVRAADSICVLAGGRIVEQGAHEELVAAGGQYARLYEAQARHYR